MNHSKTLLYLAHAAASVSVLGAILLSLSYALQFDRTVGYLDPGAFSTLLYIVLVLLGAGCIAAVCLLRANAKSETPAINFDLETTGTPTRVCSLIVAASFAAALVWESLSFDLSDTSLLLRLLCALAAALYFGSRANRRFAAFGLGAIGYFVLSVAAEYFDWTIPMNSPIKIAQTAAMVGAMLFMLSEISVRADRATGLARFGIVCALSAVFGVTNGVAMITAAIVGGIIPTAYVVRTIPAFTIGIYALSRLYSVAAAPVIATPPIKEESELPATDEVEEQSIFTESDEPTQSPTTTTPEEH